MRVGELARQARRLRHLVHPLRGSPVDYRPLLDFVGDARFVLLGTSTTGTAEFESERATITRLLLSQPGFGAVVTTLDWPDGERLNAAVAAPRDGSLPALPFPAWTVRNPEGVAFLRWLANRNEEMADAPISFYCLDEYCTRRALARTLAFVGQTDPPVAMRLRERLARAGRADGATPLGISRGLEDEIVATLTAELDEELAATTDVEFGRPGLIDGARRESIVRQAPAYYRALLAGSVVWRNLRARRLADSVTRVMEAGGERGAGRVVLWLDSLEAGDARATDMGRSGELSLGQLVRERWARDTVAVGFTTYAGTVLAAPEWGAEPGTTDLPPAQPDSYEAILHDVDEPMLLLFTAEAEAALPARRLERSIGPVLRAEDERRTYFEATIARQYDAVLHIDRTRALTPLPDAQ
jgi:erythromycin esterase-like protein